MEDRAITRKRILALCVSLAPMGREAAIELAGWFEKNEPWLLNGLRDRVEREAWRADRNPETKDLPAVQAGLSAGAPATSRVLPPVRLPQGKERQRGKGGR